MVGAGKCRNRSGAPRSLWSALVLWPRRNAGTYAALVREFYDLNPARDSLLLECILWDAQQTDRVLVRRAPSGAIVSWVVWIDPKGNHTIEVWA